MIIHTQSFRYLWEVLEGQEYSFAFSKLRVLDLGCNVGSFSLWIYPFSERIWAVDCEQNHLDNFNQTIKANEMQSVTTICDKVTDLAPFMSAHCIDWVDLLKIDIEGDEYEIFGHEDFPTKRIATIIGEYHGESPEKLLLEKGYRYIEMPNKHFLARRV